MLFLFLNFLTDTLDVLELFLRALRNDRDNDISISAPKPPKNKANIDLSL